MVFTLRFWLRNLKDLKKNYLLLKGFPGARVKIDPFFCLREKIYFEWPSF